MNESSPLWTNAGSRGNGPKFGGQFATPIPAVDEQAPVAEAAKDSPPPIDPAGGEWIAQPLNTRIQGGEAAITIRRNPPLMLNPGDVLQRRANEEIAAWKESPDAVKYLALHSELLRLEEARIEAGQREVQANLRYNRAIETSEAAEEAEAWEAARREVEDLTVRVASAQDAATMAYAEALDSYRQHTGQIQNDHAATAGTSYRELLAELGKILSQSKILDRLYEARQFRDRRPPVKPVETILPPPNLPTSNLSPAPPVMNQQLPPFGVAIPVRREPAAV